MPELLPVVVNQARIICNRDDWIRMDREDAVKKDCAERKKQKNLTSRQHRNVWIHIKATTE